MFQMLIVSVHDYCHLIGLLEFKRICHSSLMLLDKPIKKEERDHDDGDNDSGGGGDDDNLYDC